jgi:hypothetical protein
VRGRGALSLGVLGAVFGALVLCGTHAASARRGRDVERASLVRTVSALPWGDLSLAGGGRHLRFPSLEEPWAAFTDAPAMLDADPAGGAIAPPRDVWTAHARRDEGRRGR